MSSSLEKCAGHENHESPRTFMYQVKGLCSLCMKKIFLNPPHILSFSFGEEKKLLDFFIYSKKVVLGGRNESYGNNPSILKMRWDCLKIGLIFPHTTNALWAF